MTTVTQPGTCIMGGATEDDNAMRWFLDRVNGGDVVVIRVTGSNGYNNYLYNLSGTVQPNSHDDPDGLTLYRLDGRTRYHRPTCRHTLRQEVNPAV